jgi:hypothetical protein
MVDPGGGALTLGLMLVGQLQLAVVPHYDTWSEEKPHRTARLATGHLRIALDSFLLDSTRYTRRIQQKGWGRAGPPAPAAPTSQMMRLSSPLTAYL